MIYIIMVAVLLLVAVAAVVYKMSSSIGGLPILNYHKIGTGSADFLTVTTEQLTQHFRYLNEKGYNTIFLSELLDYVEQKKALPSKPVMITLDDGYRDNFTNLYPLLKEFNIKANIFLVAGFIQSPDNMHVSDNSMGEFMHKDEAIMMSKDMVQFGLHTYHHHSYSKLSLTEIAEDLNRTKVRLQQLDIPIQPCHAYTFGAYNQKDETKRLAMFDILQQTGIRLAFRVSNWVDKLPVKNKFFISRIHVSGLFPFWKFKLALWGYIKVLNRFEKFF